ncbi:MAG: glycosyltransferase family 4 protein, partial [Anaerolineae bacterium]
MASVRPQDSGIGGPTVAFVGKLSLDKGVHCLIAALPAMVARVPGLHLLLIGEGVADGSVSKMLVALEQGDLDAAGRALAEARMSSQEQPWMAPVTLYWEQVDAAAYLAASSVANLTKRVILTGYLPHEALAQVLPAVDLVVIPSLVKEAFPLVSLEALASGVLPVGPYRGGLMPILDEVAAVVEPLANLIRLDPRPEAFVADLSDKVPRVLQYLALPGMREYVAHQCHQLVVSRYEWDQVVGQLEQAYHEVL